jgi:hypothetical protein
MSRRSHHGGRHHGRPHRPAERRPAAPTTAVPAVSVEPAARVDDPARAVEATAAEATPVVAEKVEVIAADPPIDGEDAPADHLDLAPETAPEPVPHVATEPMSGAPAPLPTPSRWNGAPVGPPSNGAGPADIRTACTAPQLRRFIKSRAYVPMHELRRRFGIDGPEDDVTPVEVDARRVFVGLPEREGRMLGELLRGGDIGFELSLDPISPIVVGVYPMRPVPRA